MRSRTLATLSLLPYFAAAQAPDRAVEFVDPFIGTGGHGHTFPGACVPNGLVQLSPDTRSDGYNDWDGCGGYHYSDTVVLGFSHTHLSGTGVPDLCDVLLMPMTGTYSLDPARYRSTFSHVNEEAHAGYYHVRLDGPQVDVELTASAHVGVHRYHFKPGQAAYVVLDLLHRDELLQGSIQPRTPSEITGERRSRSWAGDQHLYYCIRFSRPMQDYVLSDRGTTRTGGPLDRPDTSYRAAFFFGDSLAEPLVVKVAISAVSVEGARRNIDAEMPGFDFDRARAAAENAWNSKLSKIDVHGGTRAQQRIFYTALYHCYVAPYLFNDVDGQYRGMDGRVHHADHNVYTVFSLWDTFRALHPLMTILEPEMTNDFIKTFLLHYREGGTLPVWELWGNETNCMIGYHSVSVIADAYMKGIRGYDAELAMKAMVASAMQDNPGLNAYRSKGYISSEDESESVSKTLEYAYDDWCIARMAREMGKDSLARAFQERSRYPENLRDAGTDQRIFYRPRRNGSFITPFDPYEVNFHYTEANAWQYSQFTPQGGTIGRAHLDSLFSTTSRSTGREQADITGLIGQYAHGNEPSHHMAYLYNDLGAPERTRAIVQRILTDQYHDAPDGLSGNEDCGQMSAWYVMSALGIYQAAPGRPDYDLGYLLFDSVAVHLPNGNTWSMYLDRFGGHVPAKPVNGAYTEAAVTEITHADLLAGRSVPLRPDRSSYPTWERLEVPKVMEAPERCEREGAPLIEAEHAVFIDSLMVSIVGCGVCTVIEAGAERSCPTDRPFVLRNTATVRVAWAKDLEPVTARFTRIAGDRSITLGSSYAAQYSGGGNTALIDGLRGGKDFRAGEWQGYRDQDVTATVDLGAVKKVKRAGAGMLQDQKSWIWFPTWVEFSLSKDGRTWHTHRVVNTVERTADGARTQDLWTGVLNDKARYLRITAANAGPCPDWHPGKGGTTWIFLDEVLIEAQ